MREVELKFLVDEAELAGIRRRAEAGLQITRAEEQSLVSTYWDTADGRLRAARVALRVRETGRGRIQTVKHGGALHGGLVRVGEDEVPVDGPEPRLDLVSDRALATRLAELIGTAPLGPVSETRITRTRLDVATPDGIRAELALDRGRISAAGRSAPHSELEIELRGGDPSGLYRLAGVLLPPGGLHVSRFSKAARAGLLEREGVTEPPLAPEPAGRPLLDAAMPAGAAARAVLRDCFRQVEINCRAVRLLDDPEAAHQLRVGLRRLRTALGLFSPLLGAEGQRLSALAAGLGREVGRLRDIDVLHDAMAVPVLPEGAPATDLILASIRAERARRLRAVRGVLSEPRVRDFLLDLSRFTELDGVVDETTPLRGFAGKALTRRWRRVARVAGDVATLDAVGRHALRKELKKLRYGTEFLAPVLPRRRTAAFLVALKRLQDVFGRLNDAAMLRRLLGEEAICPGEGAEMQRRLGWLIGVHDARAEADWEQARELWYALRHDWPL